MCCTRISFYLCGTVIRYIIVIVFVVCGNATLEEGKGRSGFLKMENVTYHVHRAVTRGVRVSFFYQAPWRWVRRKNLETPFTPGANPGPYGSAPAFSVL